MLITAIIIGSIGLILGIYALYLISKMSLKQGMQSINLVAENSSYRIFKGIKRKPIQVFSKHEPISREAENIKDIDNNLNNKGNE